MPIPLSTCDFLSAAHYSSLRFFTFHALTALNLKAAIAELHEILTMHPNDNEALYNLGWCEEKRGSIIDAANAYSSCLAAAPRRLDARLNLAALHHKHGEDYEKAMMGGEMKGIVGGAEMALRSIDNMIQICKNSMTNVYFILEHFVFCCRECQRSSGAIRANPRAPALGQKRNCRL